MFVLKRLIVFFSSQVGYFRTGDGCHWDNPLAPGVQNMEPLGITLPATFYRFTTFGFFEVTIQKH